MKELLKIYYNSCTIVNIKKNITSEVSTVSLKVNFIIGTDTTIIWCQHFLINLDLIYPTVISIYLMTEKIKYHPKHQNDIQSITILSSFDVL